MLTGFKLQDAFVIKDLLFVQKQLPFPNESTTEFEQTQEGINFFIKE